AVPMTCMKPFTSSKRPGATAQRPDERLGHGAIVCWVDGAKIQQERVLFDAGDDGWALLPQRLGELDRRTLRPYPQHPGGQRLPRERTAPDGRAAFDNVEESPSAGLPGFACLLPPLLDHPAHRF